MNRRLRTAWAAALGGALLLGATVALSASKPPTEWDGLVKRDSKRADLLYVRPDVHIKAYSKLMIDPAQVAFDKNWDPNDNRQELSRRVTPEDMEKIKTGLAQMLNETLADQLQKGGYQVVTTADENTLRLSPAIINLYINAPDVMTPGMSRSYVMDAGHMTLLLEFRDAVTGQLLARALDTKQGTDYGRMQVANSVTNSAEAKNAMSGWAKALVKGLDTLKVEHP